MLTMAIIILKKMLRLSAMGNKAHSVIRVVNEVFPAEASLSSELITGAVRANWHSAAQLQQGGLGSTTMQGTIRTTRKAI